MKNVLVCVKAVPASLLSGLDNPIPTERDGALLQWNIADESALEAALRLVDTDGSVTVLTMGPGKLKESMRELLARGADRAVLISDRVLAGSDTHATASVLVRVIQKLGPYDAIFCGCKALDGETGQVPGELAAALNLPLISNVGKIEQNDKSVRAWRFLENGIEVLETQYPVVVSFNSYSYPLRLAGIMGMRRAKKMCVEVYGASDLGLHPDECGLKGSLTKVLHTKAEIPGLRAGVKENDTLTAVRELKKILQECRND